MIPGVEYTKDTEKIRVSKVREYHGRTSSLVEVDGRNKYYREAFLADGGKEDQVQGERVETIIQEANIQFQQDGRQRQQCLENQKYWRVKKERQEQ